MISFSNVVKCTYLGLKFHGIETLMINLEREGHKVISLPLTPAYLGTVFSKLLGAVMVEMLKLFPGT